MSKSTTLAPAPLVDLVLNAARTTAHAKIAHLAISGLARDPHALRALLACTHLSMAASSAFPAAQGHLRLLGAKALASRAQRVHSAQRSGHPAALLAQPVASVPTRAPSLPSCSPSALQALSTLPPATRVLKPALRVQLVRPTQFKAEVIRVSARTAHQAVLLLQQAQQSARDATQAHTRARAVRQHARYAFRVTTVSRAPLRHCLAQPALTRTPP